MADEKILKDESLKDEQLSDEELEKVAGGQIVLRDLVFDKKKDQEVNIENKNKIIHVTA